jgi:hypothetical protein
MFRAAASDVMELADDEQDVLDAHHPVGPRGHRGR